MTTIYVPAETSKPRFIWTCGNGCGECAVKRIEFEFHREEDLDGNLINSATEPHLVSACCGAELTMWDSEKDEEVIVMVAGERPAPCPRGADKPEATCTNRHQCWEPCGELGNSEEHVRVPAQRVCPSIEGFVSGGHMRKVLDKFPLSTGGAETAEPVAYRRVVRRSSGKPYYSYTETRISEDDEPLCLAASSAPAQAVEREALVGLLESFDAFFCRGDEHVTDRVSRMLAAMDAARAALQSPTENTK